MAREACSAMCSGCPALMPQSGTPLQKHVLPTTIHGIAVKTMHCIIHMRTQLQHTSMFQRLPGPIDRSCDAV
jgi:hypothetical protein